MKFTNPTSGPAISFQHEEESITASWMFQDVAYSLAVNPLNYLYYKEAEDHIADLAIEAQHSWNHIS